MQRGWKKARRITVPVTCEQSSRGIQSTSPRSDLRAQWLGDRPADRGRPRARARQRLEHLRGGHQIKPLAKPRWTDIKCRCAGQIGSLVEVLKGSISKGVMEIVTRKGEGLFPSPQGDCAELLVSGLGEHVQACGGRALRGRCAPGPCARDALHLERRRSGRDGVSGRRAAVEGRQASQEPGPRFRGPVIGLRHRYRHRRCLERGRSISGTAQAARGKDPEDSQEAAKALHYRPKAKSCTKPGKKTAAK